MSSIVDLWKSGNILMVRKCDYDFRALLIFFSKVINSDNIQLGSHTIQA